MRPLDEGYFGLLLAFGLDGGGHSSKHVDHGSPYDVFNGHLQDESRDEYQYVKLKLLRP